MRTLSFLMLLSLPASAQVLRPIGDLMILEDDANGSITGLIGGAAIFPSPQEQFCRAAFNKARMNGLNDIYDAVVVFSTFEGWTDINNVWQGPPIRAAASGIGRSDSPTLSTYNTTRLMHQAFMGTLGHTMAAFPGLPASEPLPTLPDSNWKPSIGVPLPVESLTGIEMLGHEFGHHWLLGIEFDQNNSKGKQHFIRGFSANMTDPNGGTPNQHYSDMADSRSVMYGECITDLGSGSFKLEGCERKYSHIDQYLMGLRGSWEVSPMMVLEDPGSAGQGVDSIPMKRGASRNVSGMIRHDITADEITRAMGSRNPAYPNTRNCWKTLFLVVLAPGQSATNVPAYMIQKAERYRARWAPWFNFATDGRGSMDTRIVGNTCQITDGGVSPFDAGMPPFDAGQPEPDSGITEPDAGEPFVDAGEIDAGQDTQQDAGITVPVSVDGGPSKEDTRLGETGKVKDSCGCQQANVGDMAIMVAGLLFLVSRRRR
jgi:hypothetical protein